MCAPVLSGCPAVTSPQSDSSVRGSLVRPADRGSPPGQHGVHPVPRQGARLFVAGDVEYGDPRVAPAVPKAPDGFGRQPARRGG